MPMCPWQERGRRCLGGNRLARATSAALFERGADRRDVGPRIDAHGAHFIARRLDFVSNFIARRSFIAHSIARLLPLAIGPIA
jgi:hypothetical protein